MKKYQQPQLEVIECKPDVIVTSNVTPTVTFAYTEDYFTDSWEGGES